MNQTSKNDRIALVSFAMLMSPTLLVAEEISALDAIRKLQSAAPTDQIVSYCHTYAPDLDKKINSGYTIYLKNLDDAMAIWISEDPGTQSMSSVNSAEFHAELSRITDKVLDKVRLMDPHKYCSWVEPKLPLTTSEDILVSLRKYSATVKTPEPKK